MEQKIMYVMVDEFTNSIVDRIEGNNGDNIYAEEAITIMTSREDYNPTRHFLYLKVGQQKGL